MLSSTGAFHFGFVASGAFRHAMRGPTGVILIVSFRFRSAHVALKTFCFFVALFTVCHILCLF